MLRFRASQRLPKNTTAECKHADPLHKHRHGPNRCCDNGRKRPDFRIAADHDGGGNEVGQVEDSSGDGPGDVLAEEEACR